MSECGLENSESIFQSTGSQFTETSLAIVQHALSGHFLLCSLLISALFRTFHVALSDRCEELSALKFPRVSGQIKQ
jgi:hypothetical protein